MLSPVFDNRTIMANERALICRYPEHVLGRRVQTSRGRQYIARVHNDRAWLTSRKASVGKRVTGFAYPITFYTRFLECPVEPEANGGRQVRHVLESAALAWALAEGVPVKGLPKRIEVGPALSFGYTFVVRNAIPQYHTALSIDVPSELVEQYDAARAAWRASQRPRVVVAQTQRATPEPARDVRDTIREQEEEWRYRRARKERNNRDRAARRKGVKRKLTKAPPKIGGLKKRKGKTK